MAATSNIPTHTTAAPNACHRGKIFAYTVPPDQLPLIMHSLESLFPRCQPWIDGWPRSSESQLLVFACDNTRNLDGEHAAPAEPVCLAILSNGTSRDSFTLLHMKCIDENVFWHLAQQCVASYSLQQVSTALWWDMRSPIWNEALATVSAMEYARPLDRRARALEYQFVSAILPSMLDAARSLPSVVTNHQQDITNDT